MTKNPESYRRPPIAYRLSRPAVFLDRDGTINIEVNYLHQPDLVRLENGVGPAIAGLNRAGYVVVVVTNQAGIARGYYDEAAMHAVHRRIAELLAADGAHIDDWRWCPHHPDFSGACACRKPEPALLLDAARELNLDLPRSWMVGDKASDVQAGIAAGCRAILVTTGYGHTDQPHVPPDTLVVPTLMAAVSAILGG